MAAPSYFTTDAPGMGCDEQNGLPVSMGKMQRQPLAQGLPMPQLPPQVAKPLASFRNCRAETVPAQKTPMISAAKNIDLNFFMIASSLSRTERRPITHPGRNHSRTQHSHHQCCQQYGLD